MDDYLEFVVDVRYNYLDNFGTGPASEDMVFFLSPCPELAGSEYTFQVFEHCCLCSVPVVSSGPGVELGSGWTGKTNVDLSCIVEPFQRYVLSSDWKGNFLTYLYWIIGCLTSLQSFCDNALQIYYSPWRFVKFHDYEKYIMNWQRRLRRWILRAISNLCLL